MHRIRLTDSEKRRYPRGYISVSETYIRDDSVIDLGDSYPVFSCEMELRNGCDRSGLWFHLLPIDGLACDMIAYDNGRFLGIGAFAASYAYTCDGIEKSIVVTHAAECALCESVKLCTFLHRIIWRCLLTDRAPVFEGERVTNYVIPIELDAVAEAHEATRISMSEAVEAADRIVRAHRSSIMRMRVPPP